MAKIIINRNGMPRVFANLFKVFFVYMIFLLKQLQIIAISRKNKKPHAEQGLPGEAFGSRTIWGTDSRLCGPASLRVCSLQSLFFIWSPKRSIQIILLKNGQRIPGEAA